MDGGARSVRQGAAQVGRPTAPPTAIVAIIPAFNEADHIAEVVAKTLEQGLDVLVIDDGSTDGTAQAARQAGATVIQNRGNQGLGKTIRRGYRHALQQGADIVVQLDADGQYDAAEIPKLVQPIRDNEADMVLGSRLDDLHYDMPAIKRFGNRAFSRVLRSLTGQDIKDGQTGFRAIHREVLEKCLPINEFSYTQEMIIRVAKEGFRIRSVPVHFYPRYDGESRLFSNPVAFAAKGWWIIVRTWRDYHPFKFFVWPGVLMLLVSLTGAIITLLHFIESGRIAGRLGTLVTSGILLVFGFQLIITGLLADMIRTHTQY